MVEKIGVASRPASICQYPLFSVDIQGVKMKQQHVASIEDLDRLEATINASAETAADALRLLLASTSGLDALALPRCRAERFALARLASQQAASIAYSPL
jgi:hypothetical protein